MRHFNPGLALAGVAALFLAACGGGGGSGSSSSSSSSGGAANLAPTANAGTAQTVDAGVTVTLNGSASSDPDGSIVTYAWSQTSGSVVPLTNSGAAQPGFTAPAVQAVTTLTFSLVVTDNRGASSTPSTVDVVVNPVIAGNANITGKVRFERVRFQTTGFRSLDYANPVLQPARGVIVRALNAGTQAEIATGVTDANGDYLLSVPRNIDVTIQVVARMRKTGAAPTWDVRVQDGVAGNLPFTFLTASFPSASGVTQDIDIPTGLSTTGQPTGTRASAPFAILDTLYTAQQVVLGAAPTLSFPALVIDWGSQSEGTFFTSQGGQHIALLSDLTEDTDEFDQHVVAHEYGHYIEFNFSRADNIGGAHGLGDRLDPRVAFGEGFGYAFAAIVLNDPVARDSFFDGTNHRSGGFNIEDNPPAPNDSTGCWCSESSVWSILYDIADSNSDNEDTLSLGFQPIWSVLIGPQKTTPAFTTIFSFITALKAAQPTHAAAIDTLVSVQNIDSAGMDAFGTGETHFPSNVAQVAALPLYTMATLGGGPVTLRNVDDAGNYNKLGNHRYVRFHVPSTRSVDISLATSNATDNDPDFILWRAGTFVASAEDPPPGPETTSLSLTAGDYLLDIYDCANGCTSEQGTAGDYNLTVTIQ